MKMDGSKVSGWLLLKEGASKIVGSENFELSLKVY
jgi:hypothetical protein